MEVHPPHGGIHSWRDFWIHLGTITVGLLIAISLEQSVEWMHRIHERHVLQHDLREEAEKNIRILSDDMHIADSEAWMQQAMAATASAKVNGGKVTVMLAPAPCYAGTLNSPHTKYFAPSEAVWTAARESGVAALIPAAEARVYARLAHNQELLSGVRDRVAAACDEIASLEQRLSVRQAGAMDRTWTLTPEQAEKLADTASRVEIAIKALIFRLKTVQVSEEGILDDRLDGDRIMQMIGSVGANGTDDTTSNGQTTEHP